jgi:hypothetical protein
MPQQHSFQQQKVLEVCFVKTGNTTGRPEIPKLDVNFPIAVSRQYHDVRALQGIRGYLTKLNNIALKIKNPRSAFFIGKGIFRGVLNGWSGGI